MLGTLRRKTKLFSWPTLAAVIVYLNGCIGYNERPIPVGEPLVVGADKQLVLHLPGRIVALDSATVDKRGLQGSIRSLYGAALNRESLPGKGQRVDIWLKSDLTTPNHARMRLDWNDVDRISIYDVSVGKTLLMWTGVAAGIYAIVIIIILLTKSSCPFVYADNGGGTGYDFQGEIFSGAIYPQLERDDWMPLPAPRGPQYKLRITNEVKEIQHIDAASLLLARHPHGTSVLLDREGRPHTLVAPAAPVRCASVAGRDVSALLARRDSLAYLGGDGISENGWQDGIDLAFARPAGARSAKLILHAKNSFWLDYLYGQFQDLFGDGLEQWNGKMRQAPRAKLDQWFKEQNLPITVELEGPQGWREIASLQLPGPMAARDFLVPFELPAQAREKVNLRLRSGYLFWEIDYAALDFSPDQPVDLVSIAAESAQDQAGHDLRVTLASGDGVRYDQPRVGDAAELAFAIPAAPEGMAQSAFLATRGYYDILRKPAGKPNTSKLKRFRSPGALPRFSAQHMLERAGTDGHGP